MLVAAMAHLAEGLGPCLSALLTLREENYLICLVGTQRNVSLFCL
jgi:hypothetical protein